MAADTAPVVAPDRDADVLLRRRVARGVFSNYVGQAITIGTWLLLTPFLLTHLGPSTYGIWVLVSSIVGYGALLDLGIGGAVVKYLAEYHARGAFAGARALIATTLRLYSGLGLLVILLALALAPFFSRLFRVPSEDGALASQLVLLLGLSVGIALPCSTVSAVLRGLQRHDLVTLVTTIARLASALGTVVIVLLGGGILGVVALNVPITLLLQVVLVHTLRRIAPELRFGWRGAERRLVRGILSYSSSVFLIQAAGRLQSETDEIVIGVMLPVSAITPYALARKLSESVQLVANQFMQVLMPLASRMHATDDRGRLRELYVISTRLTLAISLPIAGALIFLAGPILTLWVGAANAEGTHLVAVLTIAIVIATSQWPAGSILQGMARHHFLAMSALGNGIANLVLSFALAPRFGLMGVAVATLIPGAIENLCLVLPYALRSVRVGPGEALREIGLPALLPAIPAVFAVWKLSAMVAEGGLLAVLAVSATGAVVYAVGYLAFPATDVERQACRWGIAAITRLVVGRLHRA